MNHSTKQTCCASDESLTLYAYDELDAAATEELARHLKTCGDCRARLAGLDDFFQLLPRGEVQLSAEEVQRFNEKVLRAVRNEAAPVSRFRPFLGWGLAAGALALLLVSLRQPEVLSPVPSPVRMATEQVLPERTLLLDLELLQNLELAEALADLG